MAPHADALHTTVRTTPNVEACPQIAVVIVNYRTPELVMQAVQSLQSVEEESLKLTIFIGDAESGDQSVEKICAFLQEKQISNATCFDIGANNGFAYGNNFILSNYVLPCDAFEYIYFLNPDAYIRTGALKPLIDVLDQDPDIAIAGSRLENPDGTLRAFGFNFPTPWREFFRGARLPLVTRLLPATEIYRQDLERTCEVDWVSGASFVARRTAVDGVGVMDSGYFLYFEEVDWMFRMREAGHKIVYVAESHVVHLGGQATGAGNEERRRPISKTWLDSRAKFFRDHYGAFGLFAATGLYLVGDAIYRLHRLIRFKPIEDPPHLWQSYLSRILGNNGDS